MRLYHRFQPQATRRQILKSLTRLAVFSGVFSLVAFGISFTLAAQLKARSRFDRQQTPIFKQPAINVFRLPPLEVFWSPADLQQKASNLFATPNSVGAIALGAAEGTRTHRGHHTAIWREHIDPGNGAVNRGTFSWQLGSATPEDADRKGLRRIQQEAIPALIHAAMQEQIGFDIETLVQGADLWNQSPNAGADFVRNLKQCLEKDLQQEDEILLCARVASFYNSETGEFEASGFDGDPEWLEEDQLRRMDAIRRVLEHNQGKALED